MNIYTIASSLLLLGCFGNNNLGKQLLSDFNISNKDGDAFSYKDHAFQNPYGSGDDWITGVVLSPVSSLYFVSAYNIYSGNDQEKVCAGINYISSADGYVTKYGGGWVFRKYFQKYGRAAGFLGYRVVLKNPEANQIFKIINYGYQNQEKVHLDFYCAYGGLLSNTFEKISVNIPGELSYQTTWVRTT